MISFICSYRSLFINWDELNSLHISSNWLSSSAQLSNCDHYYRLDCKFFVESLASATHNNLPSCWLYSGSIRWMSMGVEHFGKILLGANHNTCRKTCSIATFSTTNPERVAVGLWIRFLVLSPIEFDWRWSGLSALKFVYGWYYGMNFIHTGFNKVLFIHITFQHILVGLDHPQGTSRWNS